MGEERFGASPLERTYLLGKAERVRRLPSRRRPLRCSRAKHLEWRFERRARAASMSRSRGFFDRFRCAAFRAPLYAPVRTPTGTRGTVPHGGEVIRGRVARRRANRVHEGAAEPAQQGMIRPRRGAVVRHGAGGGGLGQVPRWRHRGGRPGEAGSPHRLAGVAGSWRGMRTGFARGEELAERRDAPSGSPGGGADKRNRPPA
jgi:hypothetical protein